jgi:hypothetical protein
MVSVFYVSNYRQLLTGCRMMIDITEDGLKD